MASKDDFDQTPPLYIPKERAAAIVRNAVSDTYQRKNEEKERIEIVFDLRSSTYHVAWLYNYELPDHVCEIYEDEEESLIPWGTDFYYRTTGGSRRITRGEGAKEAVSDYFI